VASIVAVMMAIILFQGFRRVDDLAAEVAVAHLQASSHQLRATLQLSVNRLRRDMAQLSSSAPFEQATSAFATDADRSAARAALNAELQRSPQAILSVALWSRDGQMLAAVGDTSNARLSPPIVTELDADGTDTSRAAIAPLMARGDSIFLSVVGRVRDQAGRQQGSIVEVRRSAQNPAALDLLRGLVGPDARILIGNARENLWSNFSQREVVEVTTADSSAGEHDTDGIAYLHSIEPIPGTPWRIMVDVPRQWATARASRVILEIGTLALLMLVVGVGIVWIAIHRSLRPLEEVTDSVGRLAHGDFGERVRISTGDEFGALAAAFNSMATKVEDSTRQLASRADALESANRELQESQEQYRLLVEHLPDGILVHREGIVTFANCRAAQLLGLDEGGVVGQSVADFVEVEGREGNRELKLRRQDGKRIVVEATDIRLSHNGQSATQTILHDVTQKRLLEEELRHAQKMDAAGRLAGGVAHDFNNILTVIDAYAEFAMKPGEPEEARREDIAEIRKASAAAARLTRQLLAFSRKQALTRVELDINAIVLGLQGMLTRVIGQNIGIKADLAEPLWPVYADAGHLEQVIMNLAVNARDAMPEGGNLDFRTSNLGIGADYRTPAGELVPEGQYILLAVEDSGVGIPEEVQAQVFEPFFTTKQVGHGTGLGLSTVYGIVKQSGGFIWLYSEAGRGTSFKILLPRSMAEASQPALSRTSEHRIQAIAARILLVEDQAAVRSALARALRDSGFVVDEAADAETAKEMLGDDYEVDLIVSDMMMRGMTGAELAEGVLAAGRDIPIIIMSGYSEEFTNREWRLPQNVVFLDKPVAPSELIRSISRLLD
jgi:PAS domain S-box-containing protein